MSSDCLFWHLETYRTTCFHSQTDESESGGTNFYTGIVRLQRTVDENTKLELTKITSPHSITMSDGLKNRMGIADEIKLAEQTIKQCPPNQLHGFRGTIWHTGHV